MKFIIFFYYFVTFIHTSISVTYSCNKTENNICSLTKFSLQTSDFRIQSPTPENIHTLQITNSNISVLPEILCNHLQNLIVVAAKQISLRQIPTTTFQSCVGIKKIDLSQNEIEEIADGTFGGLKYLTHLHLHNNHLKFFDPAIVEGSTNIMQLALVSNNLLEIDENVLLRYLPKLNKIFVNDNEFPCDRIMMIDAAFVSRNVTNSKTFLFEKKREFKLEVVDGVTCMPRGRWSKRVMEASVDNALESFKSDESLLEKSREIDGTIKDTQHKITQNFSRISETLEPFTKTIDVIYETIEKLTMSYNSTFLAHYMLISNLTNTNNEFLLKINVLERNNADMHLVLEKIQNALELHENRLLYVYVAIGLIITLTFFSVIFTLVYRHFCVQRHRRRHHHRTPQPKHISQLSLETNVCRL